MENEFISRIIQIYDYAILDYKNDPNQKSLHWESYNKRIFNKENLLNFRKENGLSLGLDDALHDERLSFNFFSKIINDVGENFVYDNLDYSNIGNSTYTYKFFNYYIDYNKLIHIHWLRDIKDKILLQKKINIFCEIGGGYGSLSNLILKNSNSNSKLISIDLPEANLLTSYYLQKNFPNKIFFLYDDYLRNKKLSRDDLDKYDIFILPPWANISKEIKIDLFINTRSMMEMEMNIIKKYFIFIHSHIAENGFFLNVNRYEKETVGEKIRIADYPYDKNWDVILSKPSFNQDHVHFIITQRKFSNFNNHIFEELNRISKIGKKFYIKSSNISFLILPIKKHLKNIIKLFLKYFIKKNLSKKLINFLKNLHN